MINNQQLTTVETTLRSDHLEAIINYALQQAKDSGGEINPLQWGDNENCIGLIVDSADMTPMQLEIAGDDAAVDLIATLEAMLQAVRASRGADYNGQSSHCDLMVMPLPRHFKPTTAWV
jgi:hypothetical protein